jgi:hypothetical protein
VLLTNDGDRVLVGDWHNNRVVVYSAYNLSYLDEWTAPPDGLPLPSGLAQAPGANGHIFVSSRGSEGDSLYDTLFELESSGNLVNTHNVASEYYEQLAVDNTGKLYGANIGGKVTHWDPSSGFTANTMRPTDGTNFFPVGVAVDRRTGNVLATDYYNMRVVAFNSDGDFLGTIITGISGSLGVAVDAAGNTYVPEWALAGKLRKYDSSGRLLGVYSGTLSHPWGVLVSGYGTVWVTQWSSSPQVGGVHNITCMF